MLQQTLLFGSNLLGCSTTAAFRHDLRQLHFQRRQLDIASLKHI